MLEAEGHAAISEMVHTGGGRRRESRRGDGYRPSQRARAATRVHLL